MNEFPVIGLMLGDMTGIGPEISAKLLASGTPEIRGAHRGDRRCARVRTRLPRRRRRSQWRNYDNVDAIDWSRERSAADRSRQHRPVHNQTRRVVGRIGPTHRRDAQAHDRPRARRQTRRHLLRAAQQGRAAPRRLEIPRRAPDVRRADGTRRFLRRNERDQGILHLPRDLARRAARGDRPDHARAHHVGDTARRSTAARKRRRATAHRRGRAQSALRRERPVRRRGNPHHPPDRRSSARERHRLQRAHFVGRDIF